MKRGPHELLLLREDRRFPGRHAGASLKPLRGVDGEPVPACFPGRHAGASLKRRDHLEGVAPGLRFPGRHAGASLKRRLLDGGRPDLAEVSPADTPGPH